MPPISATSNTTSPLFIRGSGDGTCRSRLTVVQPVTRETDPATRTPQAMLEVLPKQQSEAQDFLRDEHTERSSVLHWWMGMEEGRIGSGWTAAEDERWLSGLCTLLGIAANVGCIFDVQQMSVANHPLTVSFHGGMAEPPGPLHTLVQQQQAAASGTTRNRSMILQVQASCANSSLTYIRYVDTARIGCPSVGTKASKCQFLNVEKPVRNIGMYVEKPVHAFMNMSHG